MALTKTPRTIVANQSLAAAAAPLRGAIDLNGAQGPSRLTIKIVNGGTGPTTQCTARVLIAHKTSLPALGAAGTDWKTHFPPVGPGVAINAVGEWSYPIGRQIMCLEVEFIAPTGQAVTVEAFLSEYTSGA
ncbi:hypothetical protein [Nitrosospira sp. Nsp1]|uniref:hypothetical protein n=1 Tax=Nitrosospira sp. Nsp1 TaxID=136547 RepID=UPI0008850B6E|nr:hypothetical protein [Nitrosospira sp. Nsp1]SCX40381.1 hypothetical protein SAMN05720354_103100 [Nitrosospira sp. Nsp1]